MAARGTQPAYKFMVIIPLLTIELKATPSGNPTKHFIGGGNLSQCCVM